MSHMRLKSSVTEHAKVMRHAGYEGALDLLHLYESKIPSGTAVLEVGPYYNPLGNQIKTGHPWVLWEYDTAAAAQLAKENPTATIFQADLAKFKNSTWNKFLKANAKKFKELSPRGKPGALILSSVLNYFDFRKGLEKMIPQLEEGGLLVLSNTDEGDGDFFYPGQLVPTAEMIFETLVQMYPSQMTILDGAIVDRNIVKTHIQLAATFNWKNKYNTTDLYAEGIGILVDRFHPSVEGISAISRNSAKREEAKSYSTRAYEQNEPSKIARWGKERETYISMELEKRHQLFWQLSRWPKGSEEAEKLKAELSKTHATFIPERGLLLEALEIEDQKSRIDFLNRELGEFLKRMGHQMPDLQGPQPTAKTFK